MFSNAARAVEARWLPVFGPIMPCAVRCGDHDKVSQLRTFAYLRLAGCRAVAGLGRRAHIRDSTQHLSEEADYVWAVYP